MSAESLIPWLQTEVARLLDASPDSVSMDTHLLELGLDSLGAARLCGAISEKVGFNVDPMVVYDHPTIAGIAMQVAQRDPASR
jgi:aryl carrier-like protein